MDIVKQVSLYFLTASFLRIRKSNVEHSVHKNQYSLINITEFKDSEPYAFY